MSKSSGISDLVCALLSFNLFLRGNCTNWGHYTSNLANVATISLVCIRLLVVSICQGVHRKQQRINDSLFAAYHPSLSFSLSVEDCWATAPAVMPVWLHESHKQRMCRQCCVAAISELPYSSFSHGLWRHQSSNLLCFCWPGSLSVGLLPVDVRTT